MTYTQETANKAAAIGAAWLDANIPTWTKRVSPSRLNMVNCSQCVIGQLFGDYNAMLRSNLMRHLDAAEYGFDVPRDNVAGIVMMRRYGKLRAAWVSILSRRQNHET